MKKWLLTFCAFGLITTQAATANASTNKEETKDPSIQRIVKVINEDRIENMFADLLNNLMGDSKGSLKEFSTNLLVKKINLEETIKVTKNKELVDKSTKDSTVAKKNNEANQQQKVEKKVIEKQPATKEKEKQETTTSTNQAPTENIGVTSPTTSTNNSQPVDSNKSSQATQTTSNSVSNFEAQVVELTNAERAKYGLAPLKSYQPLMTTAHAKSADMANNHYFSHTSPTYGSPFDQMKAAGISYRAAGENIAQGQRTPQEVVQAWMNSSGHRANILNANFTHIGVGYVSNGNYWTQQFAQM